MVADEKVGGLGSDNQDNPGLYVTTSTRARRPTRPWWCVCQTNSTLLQRSIRDAIRRVNKDQVIDDMKTLDQLKVESVAGERFRSILMGIFAAVALLLAAIGLYGVISYSVLQRTREIGIRTALGANPGNIRGLVSRSAMTLTALGLLPGIGAALGLAQFLSSMLFNTGKI